MALMVRLVLPFLIAAPLYHGLTSCQWLYNLSDSFLSSWLATLSRDTKFNSSSVIFAAVSLRVSLCPFNHSLVSYLYLVAASLL